MLTGNKNLDFVILNKLEDNDLVNVCQTNTAARDLCDDQRFWLNRIMFKFPYLSLDILKQYKGNRDWSQYYIEDLRKINLNNKKDYLKDGAHDGRLDHVMISVNKGVDVETMGSGIRYASSEGYLDIVKYLVTMGGNVNYRKDYAIRSASKNNYFDIVKYLVENGADIHTKNDDPLIWASINGNLNMVKFLVNSGSDIHTIHDLPIREASKNGHLEVVKYLVEEGANARAKRDMAIEMATKNGHTDVVNYLVSIGVPN